MNAGDWGQLLLGVAAVITAIGGVYAIWRTGSHVKDVKQQVGNGDITITELLRQLIGFEQYQHTRNHDLMNAITPLKPLVELLLDELKELREQREAGE